MLFYITSHVLRGISTCLNDPELVQIIIIVIIIIIMIIIIIIIIIIMMILPGNNFLQQSHIPSIW